MKKLLDKLVILLVTLQLFGCSSAVTNYSPETHLTPATEGEIRLWHQSEKAEEAIRKSGQLVSSVEIDDYLQQVMDKLFPEYQGYLRVRALRQPVLNAFAMPNGSIYINSGLLSVMQNEAQLATVLAHEGVHFLNKHSARQREHFHQSAGWMVAISMLGIPLLAEVTFASAITGYSRSHETEADIEGFKRLQNAGYDVREAKKTFEHLLREVDAEDIDVPFFFASHPKLQNRVSSFSSLAQGFESKEGNINREEFLQVLSELRVNVLGKKIEKGRYNSVIAVLEDENLSGSYGNEQYFYLGEAYRLRAGEGDLEKAITQFTRYSELEGEEKILKSRGISYLKLEKFDQAKSDLSKYLDATDSTKATDRRFVMQYLRIIDKKRGGGTE